MRGVVLVAMTVSAVALADILPQKVDCGAPSACRACSFSPGEKEGKRVPVRIRGFKITFVLQEAR